MGLHHADVNSPAIADGPPATRTPPEGESLLAQLHGFLGPRYTGFVIAIALLMGVLLGLAAYLQADSRPRIGPRFWLLGLDPAIVVYILAIHPFMHRRWSSAMQSLEALAPRAGTGNKATHVGRRGEWGALLLGALAGIVVARREPGTEAWIRLYSEAVSALMFALLAAVIYGSVARSRHLAAFSRAGLELKVFDAHLLTPFAQWGQGLSLVFVGGISLSLLFQSYQSLRSLESVVIYGGLIGVAMTLFFMSMWTVHVALARAQEKELARVRRDLAVAREAMARHGACDTASAVQGAYFPVVVLGIYERQVLEAPTWPFNPAIVGRVFASVGAPLGVYLLKLAFGVGGGP